MNLEFLYCINVVLIARLILTFNDQGVSIKQTGIISAVQMVSLFVFSDLWLSSFLFFLILIVNALFYFGERRSAGYLYEIRLFWFFTELVLFSIFCAPVINLRFNNSIITFIFSLKQYSVLLSFVDKTNWLNTYTVLMGFLMVMNESNLLLRAFFHLFRIVPGNTTEVLVDKQEYNAGRIIGILERIIIYFSVLYNQVTVIGFLMAAKGFTRFKEMDNRSFAEYILIGTLLSTLMGIFIGVLARSIIGY